MVEFYPVEGGEITKAYCQTLLDEGIMPKSMVWVEEERTGLPYSLLSRTGHLSGFPQIDLFSFRGENPVEGLVQRKLSDRYGLVVDLEDISVEALESEVGEQNTRNINSYCPNAREEIFFPVFAIARVSPRPGSRFTLVPAKLSEIKRNLENAAGHGSDPEYMQFQLELHEAMGDLKEELVQPAAHPLAV